VFLGVFGYRTADRRQTREILRPNRIVRTLIRLNQVIFRSSWNPLGDDVFAVEAADDDFFLRRSPSSLERVRPDGETVFSFDDVPDNYSPSLSRGWRSSLLADDSGVYFAARPDDESESALLYTLDAETGEERWRFSEPNDGGHDGVTGTIRIGDLLIYASQSDGSGSDQEPIVRALNVKTGDKVWRIDKSREFVIGLAASENRLFLQETFRYQIYDLSTMDVLDEERLHMGFNSPAQWDETVYFGGETIKAWHLPSDSELWSVNPKEMVSTTPGVGEIGAFFGTEAGYVFGYDKETGDQLWEDRVDGVVGHPPVVEDGIVWIGTDRGTLSGFTERSGELVFNSDVSPGFSFAVQGDSMIDIRSSLILSVIYGDKSLYGESIVDTCPLLLSQQHCGSRRSEWTHVKIHANGIKPSCTWCTAF